MKPKEMSDMEWVLDGYKDLLIEAINLYEGHYPNNFRKTWKEYFHIDIKILETMTGKSIDEILGNE